MTSPFLWGTTTTFNLLTTELESVTSGSVAASSVGGSSGNFSSTQTGNYELCTPIRNVGNPGCTSAFSAGACLSGWFLEGESGVYPSLTVAPNIAPDFSFTPPLTTVAAGTNLICKKVPLPALTLYVLIQNNLGVTMARRRHDSPIYPMRTLHRKLLRVARAGVALVFFSASAFALDTGPEEFVGPFANWLNVQTTCGATGNGTKNDATAIQTCINDLSATNPVLYFPPPSVCYNITAALTITASYYTLTGASPATTPICWGGTSGGTMLHLNGVAYGSVGRLTFNGKGTAGVLINQSWDGSTGTFDTQNEYPDLVLENGATGFQCGALGQGCAETAMLRETFSALTNAGVAMGNQNALDMFVWYSSFVNDYAGVQNTLNSGGFHVFESKFSGSTYADLTFGATDGFDFRWNYSTGSSTFLYSGFNGGNPCAINLQGNVILDYTGGSNAIAIGCNGPMNLIDNVVRTPSKNTATPVALQIAGASVFSVGNTWTVPNPIAVTSPGEIISLDDITVPRSYINPTAPTLPPAPPNNSRVITEVSPGASSATLQTDITNACASGKVRPVVHPQAGLYTNISVTIPANCDIQLIGDGPHVTHLQGTGSAPVLTFTGPNFATLRNILVTGNGGVGIYDERRRSGGRAPVHGGRRGRVKWCERRLQRIG